MDNPKKFAALLTGVMKKLFEGNEMINAHMIKEQVFHDSPETEEEINRMIGICSDVMKEAAFENSELPHFESLLTSVEVSATQAEVFTKFWLVNRLKMHDAVCKDVTWSDSLEKFSWRIDVKTKSRAVAEMNDPVAIVEMKLKGESSERDNRRVVRFELDSTQLEDVLSKISTIEKVIQKHMH